MRAIFISAFLVLGVAHAAEISPISMRVEQKVSNDSNKFRHVQSKALKVFLTNRSTGDLAGVEVKHYVFGRHLKSGDLEIAGKGVEKASVPSMKTVTIETPEVKTKYADEHGKQVAGGGGPKFGTTSRKAGKVKYKEVEASGTKLVGYAVQVFLDGRLVAEEYSEPGLKDKVPKES